MKKGSISIETIIIIILALLVLVIVAAAFSGGMKQLWEKVMGIGSTTTELTLEEAQAKCTSICGTSQSSFCTAAFPIKDLGPRNCRDITTCTGAPC